ncbi:filamentous hemagglutinin N-terminal domain-containing protein [Sulfuricurvum sp.]|uniref:filamentous hemagglutinin N-terminal domain-containing protein n=1 Tax=Sulfuricurvum sp. TaxID=2025608 RepID=UPI00273567C4|nr:filamentous hemagglutinin N-terminal domain-containing protein [Sulfuricurvum sp.]
MMKYTPDFSSRFRILKGGKISLVVSALVAGSTMSFAAPSGGTVTTGSATINQSGSVTTINQSTNKASINWNSFSIAPSETVNFVQPSAQSVTLNRVVGTSQSLIQGAMNANGQVFLINPNGVLFTNGSQINVGGLVASTLNITDANFQAGNYVFEGNSQNSIINMGTITAHNGGYVAMMGKTVQNEGTIVATMGNVQMASGEKISLNLNGNSLVKLTIDQGTLNALVENKGLIQADGGQVYLTTQALNTILDGMVNNTGIIEAQTLNDVTGKVILFAHGGTANIGGTIKAEGGFVETSGKEFAIAEGTTVQAEEWLIDPVNITINGALATAIQTGLASGNVKITTDTTDGTRLDTSSGESGSEGNINVNSAIAWSSDNTLTLSAYNNIYVNQNITHTGTSAGGVIFLYGQGTADGGTSTYSVASGKTVTSPSLQWRKGSDMASTRYAMVNGDVFFGGKYIEVGINSASGGKFGTTSKPSLFFGRQGGLSGVGMTGDADGFGTGADLRIDYFLPGSPYEAFSAKYDISGVTTTGSNFVSVGNSGTIELLPLGADNTMSAKVTTTLGGNLKTEQLVTLGINDKYFKNKVTLSNVGASTLDNVAFVRSFDPDNTKDMGGSYSTILKIEEKVSSGDTSTVVSATSLDSDAYATASGGNQSKIIYYTTDTRANVGFGGPFFGGTITDMLTTASGQSKGATATADQGMGIILSAGTLAASGTATFNYLTSLDNRDMSTILSELSTASTPIPTPAPEPTAVEPVQEQIVNSIVTTIVNSTTVTLPAPIVVAPLAPQPKQVQTQAQNNTLLQTILPQSSTNGESFGLVGSTDGSSSVQTVTMEQLQSAATAQGMGEIRVPLANNSMVELVNGGVNLPNGVSQEFYVVDNSAGSNGTSNTKKDKKD